MFEQALEYWTDAWQRSVLTLEALNERGNIHLAQDTKDVPNVLNFANELVVDGRKLPRPVNYGLVRIAPPDGVPVDPVKPPVVVVDPRAGHGPGIGGMKPDSEIGVAIRAGHPCYFVGFSPEPMPGQSIEDVCRAEAAFMSSRPLRVYSSPRPNRSVPNSSAILRASGASPPRHSCNRVCADAARPPRTTPPSPAYRCHAAGTTKRDALRPRSCRSRWLRSATPPSRAFAGPPAATRRSGSRRLARPAASRRLRARAAYSAVAAPGRFGRAHRF